MGDVMVADMFGKVNMGTFVGDNLATSVRARTMAGAVIEGTIRDYQGIVKLTDVNFFCRGVHPSFIQDATILSINLPIRIRDVTIMPGDIVLGTPSGVLFIPPHLAQEVVEKSEDVRIRDQFGHQRLREGRYTPGEVDRVWTAEIEADFQSWRAGPG
jgi:regulator of RNase E activity RraA